MPESIVFVDSEVASDEKTIYDMGGVGSDNAYLHTKDIKELRDFINNYDYVSGHNIFNHDLKYIYKVLNENSKIIDTLYLSPLLFPKNPYHSLLKDDKLHYDDLNNPVNDSKKAMVLFYDEVNAFNQLDEPLKEIYYYLLSKEKEFKYFFQYMDYNCDDCSVGDIELKIKEYFKDRICENSNIESFIKDKPIALAYVLALVSIDDIASITPKWVFYKFSEIINIKKVLLNTACESKCGYCSSKLDIHNGLRTIFGYNEFRKFSGYNLQEQAVQAAVDGKSLLTIFPTGGGKSITFQLPALMAGINYRGLTVIISPLQSLMKDQVDNLNNLGIHVAVTINGLLNSIERKEAIERVSSGKAHLLYISPEALRSNTIKGILEDREIARFVIDEAHCFSSWGQDFRIDYRYIGKFIANYQKKKNLKNPIPVSCFTATAKQRVITDISDYFLSILGINLELFATQEARVNLRYEVIFVKSNKEKYSTLRDLIISKNCPTIVYASRTKKTEELAERLNFDGITARAFNGKMKSQDKIINQEAFINNEVQVIVATSAFGMGVDKKDIKLVIHYDISDSLENYVQEAGRAGRDPNLQAECYILYNDNDLNKHFILLHETKITLNEIKQVWQAIKYLTDKRKSIMVSPLEIARKAGWSDYGSEIEMRVKTAIAALEDAGFIERGMNYPRIYATSILSKNMTEAVNIIDESQIILDNDKLLARRIMSRLFTVKSHAKAGNDEAESRIDYLADILGSDKDIVIKVVNLMRQENILEDENDIAVYIDAKSNENKIVKEVEVYKKLEEVLLDYYFKEGIDYFDFKKINTIASNKGIKSNEKNIKNLMYYHFIKNYIQKDENKEAKRIKIYPNDSKEKLEKRCKLRYRITSFIIYKFFDLAKNYAEKDGRKEVWFSVVGLYRGYKRVYNENIFIRDIEDALLFLTKIEALSIEGGFLVLYNSMRITRLFEKRAIYTKTNYRKLDEFYKHKIQQIHIVGEFANLMVKDYNIALKFTSDYFYMKFEEFEKKYFKGNRKEEIIKGVTKKQYDKIYGALSGGQHEIIDDNKSKYIVVAAGPGSGKTMVLVHKLASLLMLEDVKHEQLLMLTFSRAAAIEFKKRLIDLIGGAAYYVDVKTFHSYCFDILGLVGSKEGSINVVKEATNLIVNKEVELNKIVKSVVVIDEAQDMSENEFNLLTALIEKNDSMRVIAVGDDDQNIYSFRGSNSEYLISLINEKNATKYEMLKNYRSKKRIISFVNKFVTLIKKRMKTNNLEYVKEEDGLVEITEYKSDNFIEPAINSIISNDNIGVTCILTQKNEEALQALSLLLKKGIKAKLIESLDGFKLNDLAEIRYFLKDIDKKSESPLISDNIWNEAIDKLKEKYDKSACLNICLNIINDFDKINSRKKYKEDFVEYLKASTYEDFYDYEQEKIIISTIHKSKGHEFDNVYMLLANVDITTDDKKRELYVGMTRAKNNLYIHTNSNVFRNYASNEVSYKVDNNKYQPVDELIFRLTHKDIYLDYTKRVSKYIYTLRSGQELIVLEESLGVKINNRLIEILRYSREKKKEINKYLDKGYTITGADIQFIVAWKDNKEGKDYPIILANLYLKKQ